MARPRHPGLWLTWLAGTLAATGALSFVFSGGGDRRIFMPGPATGGHHQIAEACDACHRGGPFGSPEAMDEACIGCHGDQRQKPIDAHPRTKFTDPRNADRLVKIDVLRCVTCHVEHRPAATLAGGYTQPPDFCVHCHADVREERPTHAGMDFTTCNDAGCHNFHDNRALYTDFLLRQQDAPELLARPVLPERALAEALEQLTDYPHDRYPVRPLSRADADAPPAARSEAVDADWLATAHAASGVNCTACHQAPAADGTPGPWTDHPDHTACADCHGPETNGFQRGLHGMHLAAGLTPMTPADARLPMRPEAGHRELTCVSCHGAHRFDTRTAAVDACLGCHADRHSLAYEGSPHHRLWQRELAGELPAGSGVSCAGCHLPRVEYDANDWTTRILVEHNQNATLQPSEKMLRPVCLNCHGLGFALDALADEPLVDGNFRGRPGAHVASISMAVESDRRARTELGATR